MVWAGNIILEEVGNALREAGARGSPVKQAREREAAYSVVGPKSHGLYPSELGQCEVTSAEDPATVGGSMAGACRAAGTSTWNWRGSVPASEAAPPNHFACPPSAGGRAGCRRRRTRRRGVRRGSGCRSSPP